MSGCSRTVLRVYLVASALLIVAGNMISAFVLFRIPNALLESFPGLDCFEGPCKGFSGSTEEDFVVPAASLSASASSIATRQSRWGPDAGWLLNIVALGARPPTSPFLFHSSTPSFQIVKRSSFLSSTPSFQIVKTFFLPLLYVTFCQRPALPRPSPPSPQDLPTGQLRSFCAAFWRERDG